MLTGLPHDVPMQAMSFILVTAQSGGCLRSSSLLRPLLLNRSVWQYPLLLDKPPVMKTGSSSSNSRFQSVLNATTNRELNGGENPDLHQRSNHIDVHYHFTRENLLFGTFTLEYVQSNDNVADIMTKGHSQELHYKFLQLLRCTG
jgi:hypothetical protein